MDPATGDLLAAVSYPAAGGRRGAGRSQSLSGPRALRPVSAGLDVQSGDRHGGAAQGARDLAHKQYQCVRLPDGRVGNYIKGSKRPIRDDVQDKNPHGTLDMEHGLVVSCNAYFAQLGTYDVGAEALHDTATLLGIAAASPDTAGAVEEVAAAIVLRAGPSGGVAVPDGARGGHGGQRRRDAAGPLDHG